MQKMIAIGRVKANEHNPRFIRDERFKQLVESIRQFPEMLSLRPLVVDENHVVLGGNMRLRALKELDYKEVPVIMAKGLSEAQKREFVIKDNASFGSWDMDELANGNWGDVNTLNSWGMELPKDWGSDPDELEHQELMQVPICLMKVTFASPEQLQQAEIKFQEMIDRLYPGAHLVVSMTGNLK